MLTKTNCVKNLQPHQRDVKRIRVSFTITTEYPTEIVGQWQLPAEMNCDVPEGSNPVYDEILAMAWRLSVGSLVTDFVIDDNC